MSVAAEMSRLFFSIKVKTDADQQEERKKSASATTSRKRSNSDQHKRSRKLSGKKRRALHRGQIANQSTRTWYFYQARVFRPSQLTKKGWNLRTKISLFMDFLLKDIGVRESFELESLTSSDQLRRLILSF